MMLAHPLVVEKDLLKQIQKISLLNINGTELEFKL